MKSILLITLLIFISAPALCERIKLSTVSIEVPDAVAVGNKVTKSYEGISTYAWTRLRSDSSSYYYTYSFKHENALFEFRESHRVDIYEAFESIYKPKLATNKENKNYLISVFQHTSNEFMKSSFDYAVVEFDKGMRKITLIYKVNKTSQFLASMKTMYPVETFIRGQKNLDTILTSAIYEAPTLPEYTKIEQKGELVNRTEHHVIKSPFFLSIDFNNPIVQATPDNGFVAIFAHSAGSEIITVNSKLEISSIAHHDKIIHDFVISDKGFFSVSSTDYNLLR